MATESLNTEEEKIDALQYCISQLRACISSFRAIKKMREEMFARDELSSNIKTEVEAASAAINTVIGEVADYLDGSASVALNWELMATEVRPNKQAGYPHMIIDADNSESAGHIDLSTGTAFTQADIAADDKVLVYDSEDAYNDGVFTVSAVENSGRGLTFTSDMTSNNDDDESMKVRKIYNNA